MASPDQGFPARFSQTVDRYEPARVGRLRSATQRPGLAFVNLRDRTFVVRTHAERVTRRGRQTLVSVQGRLTWVASHRVQPFPSAEVGPPAQPAGGSRVAKQPLVAEGDLP